MGIINRFLLFFYTLSAAIIALGILALTFQVLPGYVLWNEIQYALAQWQTAAVTVVVFLLSVHFCGCSFAGRTKERTNGEFILLQGETGEVRVALSAIKNLVDKTVRMTNGVRDLKLQAAVGRKAAGKESVLQLRMKLVIGQQTKVAALSDAVREQVQRQLEEIVGITDFTLDIAVEDISNSPTAKKQRVV